MENFFTQSPLLPHLYAVLVTPFQAEGELDEASLERLVEFYIQKKVHGLAILTVLGEEAKLTPKERLRVAQIVFKQVKNRVPVVVGVSGTAESAAKFGLQMSALGAKGLLVVPPSFSDTQQVKQHYQKIGIATQMPLVVLDYPALTGKLSVSFLASLVEEVEQVQAIKLEEEPTFEKIRHLRNSLGDRLGIFGALGGVHCLPELQAGSHGLMTGYAYPEHLLQIMDHFRQGELVAADQEYERCLPLLKHEYQGGLAVRKEILQRRKIIALAKVRR
ncbi:MULTISPECIES: dihydrodipicolinate synthase family protein [Calothrix]|uniref:Dihydrodipicolinate synthase family protein n=2 Tax=Calothrix TaxID=1186 RepID=A0ABR8A6C7_9CYAN|nr:MULTISPECIES: dihydrodipicolinate synthase family protein [Calothrix]MBD2195025.1 dihydrodipicolinate synthase family protein [Calothrix parietina FACHB-288]MBD2223623.1 dihydrodipicolinate synthase family protein [Calothrix anomala FACHB-343]